MTAATIAENRERACTVQVGPLLIPAGDGVGLDVAFTVRRGLHITKQSLKPIANTCDLKIWNLSPDHRKQIESAIITPPGSKVPSVPCVISAGYKDRVSIIFSGLLRAGHSVTDGEDIVTELTTGDGDMALAQSRLTISLGKDSDAGAGLKTILKALGIGDGNLPKALALLQAQPLAARLFRKGGCLKGNPGEVMSDFCRSVGLEWSVQDGALQLTALNQPLAGTAILVDEDHGMIGSPTVDTKGLLSVTMEMIPNVKPGVILSMNAKHIKGGWRVISVETEGDTYEDTWYHRCEAKRY